ncbi:response regulator transcription factor [Sulfurovum sp.]|uniref:helix-turn-helix transcriptional regulator n=1 Tax=Sulfurovum sp. TaxID=1969726 RepID=UPI0025F05F96|nr:response regulator transcription factor [Sulfurovum sp.]
MENTLFHSGLVVKSPVLGCEEAVAYSVGWDAEVRQTEKRNRLLMQVMGFHTPHIQFGSTYYNAAFMVRGVCPQKSVVITYNQTKGVINYRNRKFDRNELLVLTRDEELDLVISGRNITFTIAIDEDYFYKVFIDYYGMDFEGTVKKRLLLEPQKESVFLDFLQFWIDYFLTHNKEYLLPEDYEQIEQEILHTLFAFITVNGQKIGSENRILKEARGLLEHSLDLDLRLSDMAKHLGVSQRTLEYTFKHNLGMTPKNYLQVLRLYAIRDELKLADPRVTKVSDIALKYAFFHMGHFASEYKKLFGESPMETLKSSN